MEFIIFKFIINYPETIKKLIIFFKYDDFKLFNWFNTENPHLGNVSPFRLIEQYRQEKLIKFIESALSENEL